MAHRFLEHFKENIPLIEYETKPIILKIEKTKRMFWYGVIITVGAILLLGDCQEQSHEKICENKTIEHNEMIKNNWRITNGNCSSNVSAIRIRIDSVYSRSDKTCYASITIPEFPLKEMCRLKNRTCFVFTSPTRDIDYRSFLRITKDCKDIYWTSHDNAFTIGIHYQLTKTPSKYARFSMSYTVYEFSNPTIVPTTTSGGDESQAANVKNNLRSTPSTMEGNGAPIQRTDNPTIATMTANKHGNSLMTTAKEKSGCLPSSEEEKGEGISIELVLAITFGILCIILLVALIILLVRFRLNNRKNSDGTGGNHMSLPSSQPDVVYSVASNVSKKCSESSEHEVVVKPFSEI